METRPALITTGQHCSPMDLNCKIARLQDCNTEVNCHPAVCPSQSENLTGATSAGELGHTSGPSGLRGWGGLKHLWKCGRTSSRWPAPSGTGNVKLRRPAKNESAKRQCHIHECGRRSIPPCLCNASIQNVELPPVSHLAANTSLADSQRKPQQAAALR